jgi:hypothetical protein
MTIDTATRSGTPNLDAFLASPAGWELVTSGELDRRWDMMMDAIDAGDCMPLGAMAEFLDMPFEAFRELIAMFLAGNAARAAVLEAAVGATKH